MLKKWCAALMVMCLFALMASTAHAAVSIGIDGLTGAQHWVWTEAEYASSFENAGPDGDWEGIVSGGGMGYNNSVFGQDVYWIGFTNAVTIPANMTDAKVYVRNNGAYNRTGYVSVDNNNTGTFTANAMAYNYHNPIYWSPEAVSAGTLSQGSHNVTTRVNCGGWYYGEFDGFFISDGPITVSNNPPTPDVTGAWWKWMDVPADAGIHQINGPVTPVFTLTGQTSVSYSLDGAAYTPGTAITSLGSHQLSVIAYDGVNRYMSGANFTVVPEPVTMVLLTIGSVFAIRRKK